MKSHFMCILLVLSAVIFSNVVPVQAAPAPVGITTPVEMEHFLDSVIPDYMEKEPIPGMVVTVVKDGQVFFAKGYGYANVDQRVPVDPQQTLFRIGSTSKLFLWTAVMQLAEQGKLDLDADINRYLDFRIPATFSEPITMKNLMTHTAGFEQSNIGFYTYDPEYLSSLGDYLKKHIPARVFLPGKVGAYSNYGAALAGYVVERVSGMSYAEYVE